MGLDLATINLALDALIKLVVIGILVFLAVILKHLDKAVQSAGRSADSVHGVAQKVHNTLSARNMLKMAQGYFLKKNEGDKL
jgi:hypothetical protein